MIGIHPDRVKYFLDISLKKLQLDYVDLYLIHYPGGFLPGKNDQDLFPIGENGKALIDTKTDLVAVWKV